MPSTRPQLNVRLTEEWAERFPALVEAAGARAGAPQSQSQVVMAALAALERELGVGPAAQPKPRRAARPQRKGGAS